MTPFGTLCLVASIAIGLYVTSPLRGDDLKPGDPAPGFRLPGSDGKTYDLTDFKNGRVLSIDRNVNPKSHGEDVAAKLKELGIERTK